MTTKQILSALGIEDDLDASVVVMLRTLLLVPVAVRRRVGRRIRPAGGRNDQGQTDDDEQRKTQTHGRASRWVWNGPLYRLSGARP